MTCWSIIQKCVSLHYSHNCGPLEGRVDDITKAKIESSFMVTSEFTLLQVKEFFVSPSVANTADYNLPFNESSIIEVNLSTLSQEKSSDQSTV